MTGRRTSFANASSRGLWLALASLPALTGCAAAVAIPLVAGGTLSAATHRHRVRAATAANEATKPPRHRSAKGKRAASAQPPAVVTSLKELPPPSGGPAALAEDDPWQKFFTYALSQLPGKGSEKTLQSAVLKPNPSLDIPDRRPCGAPFAAVVIDLDSGKSALAPDKLVAPPGVAEGLARLRAQGVVVLWISQLPASRAPDVAKALRSTGLDPTGADQLLLIRSSDDRKQLLRDNASDDVCIVAIAGNTRSDFDELFDYLRNPEGAVGLYPMMGKGWFVVPPLEGAPPQAK